MHSAAAHAVNHTANNPSETSVAICNLQKLSGFKLYQHGEGQKEKNLVQLTLKSREIWDLFTNKEEDNMGFGNSENPRAECFKIDLLFQHIKKLKLWKNCAFLHNVKYIIKCATA